MRCRFLHSGSASRLINALFTRSWAAAQRNVVWVTKGTINSRTSEDSGTSASGLGGEHCRWGHARCEGTGDGAFLMTCKRQQDRGRHKSSFPCVMCVPLVTLVTLFSISNRRSHILDRGRAARSRESRVEPESRSIQTQQEDREESNSSVGQIRPERSPLRMWTALREDQWRTAEALLRLLGYLDYTRTAPLQVKILEEWNSVPFTPKNPGMDGFAARQGRWVISTLCVLLTRIFFNWELEWDVGSLVLKWYPTLSNVFRRKRRVLLDDAVGAAHWTGVCFQSAFAVSDLERLDSASVFGVTTVCVVACCVHAAQIPRAVPGVNLSHVFSADLCAENNRLRINFVRGHLLLKYKDIVCARWCDLYHSQKNPPKTFRLIANLYF